MSLQDIRRYFETPVVEVCQALDIVYRPANTLEPNGDAYSEFIEARLQFGQMTETSVGDCTKLENIRGAFVIEYYGPKGRGPARAQTVMELLFCEMLTLKGVSDINGPNFTELNDRPYYFARMSMAIIVNSGTTAPLTPSEDLAVTTRGVALVNPVTTFASSINNEIIPDLSSATTQEDANKWIAESLEALDETLSPIDGGSY